MRILTIFAALEFLVFFVGPGRTFIRWDEWTILSSLAQNDLITWLRQPHLGHFMPISKSIYYLYTVLFGDRYDLWVLSNLLLHAVNCSLLFVILKKLFIRNGVAFAGALCYSLSWCHAENILWGLQVCILLSVLFSLISFFFLLRYFEGEKSGIWLSALFVFGAAISFGMGLAVAFLLCFFSVAWISLRKIPFRTFQRAALVQLGAFAVSIGTISLFLEYADHHGNHLGAIQEPPRVSTLFLIFGNGRFWDFFITGISAVPLRYFLMPGFEALKWYWALVVILLITGMFLLSVPKRRKQIITGFLTSVGALAVLFFLPAVARYTYGLEAVWGKRYGAFLLLPATVAFFGGIELLMERFPRRLPKAGIIALAILLLFQILQARELRKTMVAFTSRSGDSYHEFKKAIIEGGRKTNDEVFDPQMNPELTQTELARIIYVVF